MQHKKKLLKSWLLNVKGCLICLPSCVYYELVVGMRKNKCPPQLVSGVLVSDI